MHPRRLTVPTLLACAALPSVAARAQPLADLHVLRQLPGRDGILRLHGDLNPQDGLHHLDHRAILPVVMWDDFSINVAWRYTLHRLDPARGATLAHTLHAHLLRLELGSFVELDPNWLLVLSAGPQLQSDLRAVDRRDFAAYGHAVVAWSITRDWSFHFGLAVSQVGRLHLPVPVATLIWRPPGGPADVEVLLPSHARVNWRPVPTARLFAEVGYEGYRWDVEARGATPHRTVQLEDARLLLGVDVEPARGVFSGFFFGTSVWRRLREDAPPGRTASARQAAPGFTAGVSVTLTPAVAGR